MKKKALAIALIGSLWLASGAAQAPVRTPWKFRSLDYAGILRGEDGNFGQFQTINGLYKKSWFLGIGAGADFYRYRSVPLFVSVVKDLMPGKNGLFFSLDGGTDIPWYSRDPSPYSDYTESHFRAAPYWGAELGYKIKLSAHTGTMLLLTAGYSYKELKEDQTVFEACPLGLPGGACPLTGPVTLYTYRNQRVSMKAGISF